MLMAKVFIFLKCSWLLLVFFFFFEVNFSLGSDLLLIPLLMGKREESREQGPATQGPGGGTES